MSPCRRRGSCGRMGCTIPATLRPWPSVVRSLASRRWRRQQRWTGRRCVRSGAKPIGVVPTCGQRLVCTGVIRAGVRHACTGWGARGLKPTHARRQGEIGQGWGLSGGGPGVSREGKGRGLGGSAGQGAPGGPTGEAGRACGRRAGVGGTRPKLQSASEHPVAGRIRTRSVQPVLSEVLRAGRESPWGPPP